MKKILAVALGLVLGLTALPSVAHGWQHVRAYHGPVYHGDHFGRNLGIALGLTGLAIAIDNANRHPYYNYPPVVYSNTYPEYVNPATETIPVYCIDRYGNQYVCQYRTVPVYP